MRILNLVATFGFLFLSACAVGPLMDHESARTVGAGAADLVGGYGMAGFVGKFNYGLSDRWDLGLQWESLSMGVRIKYGIIDNQSKGWSLAAAAGTGFSAGGSHYYGDLMGSYLFGTWEPYTMFRVVHVTTDPVKIGDEKQDGFELDIGSSSYVYGQLSLGTRVWFDKHWLASMEAGTLFGMSSGIRFVDAVIVSAALGYHFD